MSSFKSSGDSGGGIFVPYLLVLIFILLASVPSNFFYSAQLEIGLYFIPLFFIGLTAESDATPVFLAALGLVNDIMSEMPLGFWSSLFVVFYLLCASQRSILSTASFGSYWLTFGVLMSMTYLVAYLLALLLDDLHMAIVPFLLSALICILFFPLLYFPLYLFGEAVGGSERS